MKIALAQINTTVGDFAGNVEKIRQCIESAKKRGAELLVLPELTVCGYPPGDLLERSDFVRQNLRALELLCGHAADLPVVCGCVSRSTLSSGNPLHNSAAVLARGCILGWAHKQLLPTYDVFDERRFFSPGEPAAPIVLGGRRVGVTICEDAWNDKETFKKRRYENDPVERLAAAGADLIVNISASPFNTGKAAFREKMMAALAAKYRLPLVFVNLVGGNDSLVFDGGSAVFDRFGRPIARAAAFAEDLVVADIDDMGNLAPLQSDPVETALQALVTGVRDYMGKCGFGKAIVGLSGGVDSALVLWLGAQALGPRNMTAVFMPSPYTSRENDEDTRQLAENLGVRLDTVPIDTLFETFLKGIPAIQTKGAPDLTEQNIQARIRGTILMAYANRMGALVLSTGNKSEVSVGYCTLYGDMNGGLSAIADVWKTDVYRMCRFINRNGGVIPERILQKAPSAELKPDQRDQDDLPPYDVLDGVLHAFIEEFRSVEEIVAMGYERALVEDIVRRVIRSEYKRYQAAPGIRVTPKAFGIGRRYPIAHRFMPS